MRCFEPDHRHLVDAAFNRQAARLPLYEHLVAPELMEEVLGVKFAHLYHGDERNQREYYTHYCDFFLKMGYDAVPYEECLGPIMPGAGSLANSQMEPAIRDPEDFRRYPWEQLAQLYREKTHRRFELLADCLPPGMKAVGGVGNGVFECVQDVTGYERLCFLAYDEPELFEALFKRVGAVLLEIWGQFMAAHGDAFCVLRFGDDLGYKSNTLLSPEDITRHILPHYKAIVALVHRWQKPFLLHSCGNIFGIMDALIEDVKINAKHSNEDQIAPFGEWVARYGSRIGNFGGIDTDAVCRMPRDEMQDYIRDVVAAASGHGGFAFGSGNSIPDYVPTAQFLQMNEIIRSLRGE